MRKHCPVCAADFSITTQELNFLSGLSFAFSKQQARFPAPKPCPNCRLLNRVCFRNEQNLYQGVSALSGKKLISLYAPEKVSSENWKIFSAEEWHSDAWDGLQYGRDFDFTRPFFDQFAELLREVPRMALMAFGNENCPYVTNTAYCKNCHLIVCSEKSSDCYYGKMVQSCRSCADCSYIFDSELCYECFGCRNCYGCGFLSHSHGCQECWFSDNLVGCSNCLFCSNLQRKSYCVANRPVNPAQWKAELELILGRHERVQQARMHLDEMRARRIHKYANIVNSEDCLGDFILGCKNCRDCYDITDSRDCQYVVVGVQSQDMVDCSNVYLPQERCYQLVGTMGNFMCAYCVYVFDSQEVLYSDHVFNSRHVFGCSGLRRKEFCVFNQQYSKQEYDSLAARVVQHMRATGEWGQFFPPEISPFGFNESLAYEYQPLSRPEAQQRGWHWREEPEQEPVDPQEPALADDIAKVPDSVCQRVLSCDKTGKHYKIMPIELEFYRSNRIPVPRQAPLTRHFQRERLRNPRRLYERICSCCGAAMQSTFDAARPELVYCEDCYLKKVLQ